MWSIGYSEVLKMSSEQKHFQKVFEFGSETELEEVLSDFFNTIESGVHILILCSDEQKNISEAELTNLLKRQHPDREINIMDKYKTEYCTQCRDAVGIITGCTGIVDAMRKIFSYIKAALPDVDDKFEKVCNYIEQGQQLEEPASDKIGFLEASARKITDLWTFKGDFLPEIRLVVCLPSEYFTCLTNENNYFPVQMEYAAQIVSREQWREKVLRETCAKCQELSNENKELKYENEELKEKNAGLEYKQIEMQARINSMERITYIYKMISKGYSASIENKASKYHAYDIKHFKNEARFNELENAHNGEIIDRKKIEES